MPNWSGTLLTTKGRALQAKVEAGATMTITKLKIGDGTMGSGQTVDALTDLISPKKNLGISALTPLDSGVCKVTAVVTNSGLASGFYVRELGVFAQDPNLGEILYAYTADGSPDYLPAAGGTVAVAEELVVQLAFSNAANITATISLDGLITTAILNTHKNAAVIDHPDNSVTDVKIGNRTITDTVTAAAGANTITNLFSMIGNMLKRITGKSNWYTAPATTLEAANTHITAATGAHAANSITLTPTGDVAANTVQAGIAELSAEKLALANSLASGAVYKYRDVTTYNLSGTTTGTAKITLPVAWLATTLVLEIEGWRSDGSGVSHWIATLSGFTQSSGNWILTAATLHPNCPFTSVRFGYDSVTGKCCILFGTTSTAWDNVKINVKGVFAGNSNVSAYSAGWGISIIGSETGITNIVTPTVKTLATVEDNIAPYGLGARITPLAQSYNLNNLIIPGKYLVDQPVNGPSTGSYYYDVDVSGGGTFTTQTVVKHQAGQSLIYHRQTTNNGTLWSDWQPLTTDDRAMVAKGNVGQNRNSADWNSITTPGIYGVTAAVTGQANDAPAALGIYGYGQLHVANNAGIVNQVYYGHQASPTGAHVGEIASRQYYPGQATWTPWKQLATVENNIAPYGLGTAVTRYTGDLNNLKTATGFYYADTGSANRPGDINGYIMVEVLNSMYATQTFTDVNSNLKYTRRYAAGSWEPWKQIAMTNSPAFTGIATAVTAALGTNTTQIATTAFVQAALAAVNGKVVAFNLGPSGGYVAWDFGLILQWGKYTNTSGNIVATVTLPINYTNSYVPFATPRGSNYYTGNASAYADVVSLSQVKLVLDEDNGGPASDLFWFTIGF